MKILITAPSLDTSKNVSGISTVVNNVVKNSQYSFKHFMVGKEDNEKSGIGWILKQFGLVFKFPFAIRNCNIIHINTALNPLSIVRDFTFVLIARLFRKKVLLHLHGGKYLMENCKNILLNQIIKLMIKQSSYIVVLSKLEKEIIQNKYKIENIAFLVNSIPVEELHFSRNKKSSGEPIIITFLGRIHESKGVDDIVAAMAKLITLDKNFIFNLYGTGPLEDFMVENLSKTLGDRFYFYGIVGGEAKWTALEKSDVFLLPSRYGEGLPMAMLEAMAVGNVVVVTDDASITFAVENNVNGIIVDKYNPDDIAQKLLELILDRDRLHTLAGNAIQTIQKKFNLQNYIKQLESIYGAIS